MLGRKFGSLTPLRLIRRKGHIRWECRCDCGKIVSRYEYCLVKGTAYSCGCKHPRRNRGAAHRSYRGCGQLNRQYYTHQKRMAETRNLPFLVSIEYLWDLFIKQGQCCALTGLPLNIVGHKDKLNGVEQTASLDRIDSSRGYEEGNVQWVHKDVNWMKNNFTQERFIEICRLVTALAANQGASTSNV